MPENDGPVNKDAVLPGVVTLTREFEDSDDSFQRVSAYTSNSYVNNEQAILPNELHRSILSAFGSSGDLRTISGIADAANLSYEKVHNFIKARPEIFEEFPLRLGGELLYCLRQEQLV